MKPTNHYIHKIDIVPVLIKNGPNFLAEVKALLYRGYKVEDLADGRQIVITKPGGKLDYRSGEKEDFLVWIYNPQKTSLWLISHKDIYRDLKQKGETDPAKTIKIIDALEKVYNNDDPNDVIKSAPLADDLPGELPEVLLKAYKWIWAQEDLNYPGGLGRKMSFNGITKSNGQVKRRVLVKEFPELENKLKKIFPRKQNLKIGALRKAFVGISGLKDYLAKYDIGVEIKTGDGLTDLREELRGTKLRP